MSWFTNPKPFRPLRRRGNAGGEAELASRSSPSRQRIRSKKASCSGIRVQSKGASSLVQSNRPQRDLTIIWSLLTLVRSSLTLVRSLFVQRNRPQTQSALTTTRPHTHTHTPCYTRLQDVCPVLCLGSLSLSLPSPSPSPSSLRGGETQAYLPRKTHVYTKQAVN